MNNLQQQILNLSREQQQIIKHKLQQRLQHVSTVTEEREPVAIVGVACRLPAGANDTNSFWDMLHAGHNGISKTPAGRINWPKNIDLAGADKGLDFAGYLDNIAGFDAAFFNVSPREAKLMDPQQRLLLELTWEVMEDAGYAPTSFAGSETGVFLGTCNYDYRELLEKKLTRIGAYFTTGTLSCLLANRLSYFFDLHGPSIVVDTACSSSLVAVHEALQAIWRGEIKQAIVGGASIICSSTNTVAYHKTGVLSKTGSCKTFDAAADGYARGEGAGLLLLKPLTAALNDGDHIYAVIKGSAVNHGGHANTLSSPNPQSQAELITKACHNANVRPATLSYVETHGTGTIMGDPLEIEGLKMAFNGAAGHHGGKPYCLLGALKTNIGHLEAASGIASMIKVILAMQHQQIPQNINFKQLNPNIDLVGSPFAIATKLTQWKNLIDDNGQLIPRRAGVSSFGLGGVNGHVILEEFNENVGSSRDENVGTGRDLSVQKFSHPQLFIFSAKTESSLKKYLNKFIIFCENNHEIDGDNVAYTLQVGRETMSFRLAIIANDLATLITRLKKIDLINKTAADYFYHAPQAAEEEINILPNKITTELEKIAQQWIMGSEINWEKLWLDRQPQRISLPTYAFEREDYWFE